MNFGSFQAVYTDAVITEKKEVVAAAPIVTKRDELALPDVQGLKVGRVTPASVELLWANGGGNTAGYVVAFALDASPTSCKDFKNKISDLAKQDLTISGLAAGKLYGFRVCAVDSSGRMSAGATVSRETLPATLELGSFAPLGTLPFDGSGRLRIGHNFSLPLQPSTNAQGYLATFTKNSDCAFPLKPSIQVPATPPAGSNLSGPLVQIDTLGVPDGLMFLCIHAVRDTKKRPMDGGALPVEVERTKLTLVGGGPTSNSMMLVEYSSGHDASGTIVEDATPAPVSVASPIMRLAQKKSGQVGVYYQATNSSGTSPKLILPIAAGSNPTSLYASPVGGTNYGFAGSLAAHDDNFISRFSKYNISPNTGLIIEKTASETPLAISGAQNVLGISTAVGSNGVRYSAVKEQMSTGVRAFFGGATLAEIPPASWEIDSGSNAHSIALALDANNAPHVVMKVTKPDTPNADCAIKYGRIVSANWTFQDIMTLDGSVSDVCANLSEPDIAVDKATGTIHIAVRNGSNFLHHKSIPGATPSSTTIGTSPTGSYFGNLFLRLDQFGIPYVITPILINAVEDVFAVADLNTGAWRWRVPTVLDGDDTTANPAEVTEFYLQDVLINGAPGRSYFSP
jgi:hypothetical protein